MLDSLPPFHSSSPCPIYTRHWRTFFEPFSHRQLYQPTMKSSFVWADFIVKLNLRWLFFLILQGSLLVVLRVSYGVPGLELRSTPGKVNSLSLYFLSENLSSMSVSSQLNSHLYTFRPFISIYLYIYIYIYLTTFLRKIALDNTQRTLPWLLNA